MQHFNTNIKIKFNNKTYNVWKTSYTNNRIAIYLENPISHKFEIECTVNLPMERMDEKEIAIIKNNELQMLLKKHRIITRSLRKSHVDKYPISKCLV